MDEEPKNWALLVGGFGDVIIGLGHIEYLLARWDKKDISIVYFGHLEGALRLIQAQPYVNEVRWCNPIDGDTYQRAVAPLFHGGYPRNPVNAQLVSGTGIVPEECISAYICGVHPDLFGQHKSSNLRLPFSCYEWAFKLRASIKNTPAFVVNPYSLESVPKEHHWSLWPQAIDWLLNNFPYIFFLTGKRYGDDPRYNDVSFDHPRLFTLVDETPSVLEVYALSRLCEGTITTMNGLSTWVASHDKPSLVASVLSLSAGNMFFDWVNRGKVNVFPQSTSITDFQKLFQDKFNEY